MENSITSLEKDSGLRALWASFWAMTKKELTVLARYPVQFFASFAQIFLILAIFSLAATMFSGGDGSGPPVAGITVYGFILFIFFSDTLWAIGFNIRNEQVQGTLEALYLSPANKFINLVSRVANVLLWTGALSIASIVIMSLILGDLPFENGLLGLYIFAFSLAGVFGIGFAFAALTLRIKETANTVANMLQFAFLILTANFFPFSALPQSIQFISKLIPLSYSVDAFRSTLMGYPAGFPELAPIETEIIIITVFGILMPILGYWLYQRAENYARRVGSLSEY